MHEPLTTGSLARELGAQLVGPENLPIERVTPMDESSAGSLTFIRTERFAARWPGCGASAALVSRSIEGAEGLHPTDGRALLYVDDADLALVHVLERLGRRPTPRDPGVHPSAVVNPGADVHPSAHVGPGCVIAHGASIGPRTELIASVSIGAGARIGEDCVLHPGVCVQDGSVLGDRCTLHPNVVVGADGFGYRPAPDGRGLVKIPHIGGVRIGSDVEIGAGSCIDRGKLASTIIGDGTKIDNLVQIGHNCIIGRCCIICGLTGLSGSVRLGDAVTLAGGVGVADNIEIGSGAQVGARSGVMNDVPPGETWVGYPAGPVRETAPNYAAFRTLSERMRELRRLRKRVDRLEGEG